MVVLFYFKDCFVVNAHYKFKKKIEYLVVVISTSAMTDTRVQYLVEL